MESNDEYPDGDIPKNLPVYTCPLCGMSIDYLGFYLRNRETWKGTLKELEAEWLKYDHNNPRNNCSVQLACCSCNDKLDLDEKSEYPYRITVENMVIHQDFTLYGDQENENDDNDEKN